MSDPILETEKDFENFYKRTRLYRTCNSYRQFQNLVKVEPDGTYWNFRIYLGTGAIVEVMKLDRADVIRLCGTMGNHNDA